MFKKLVLMSFFGLILLTTTLFVFGQSTVKESFVEKFRTTTVSQKYQIEEPARCTVVGDVSGDNQKDVLVGFSRGFSLYTLSGNDFEKQWTIDMSYTPQSLLIADIDTDGENEVIVGSGEGDEGGYIHIFEKDDNAGLQEVWKSGKISSFRRPNALFAGDTDNDGKNELCAAVTWYGRYFAIYEHDSGNNYRLSWKDSIGSDCYVGSVTDIDSDEKNEIIMSTQCYSDYSVRIYESNGNNGYRLEGKKKVGAGMVTTGNLNTDNISDILVTTGRYCYAQVTNSDLMVLNFDGSDFSTLYNKSLDYDLHGGNTSPSVGNVLDLETDQFAFIDIRGDRSNVHLYKYNAEDDSYSEFWHKDVDGVREVYFGDVDDDGVDDLLAVSHTGGIKIFGLDTEPQPAEGTLTITFNKGLNMVSLPNCPDTPYTAKTFAEKIGDVTLLIRYAGEFEAYLPEYDTDDGFPIEGGQGYIVNVTESKDVDFTGTVWDNAKAAPTENIDLVDAQNTWAFVIAGELPKELRGRTGLNISVKSAISAKQVSLLKSVDGSFRIVFVDAGRDPVVVAGDKLMLEVKDTAGRLVAEKQIIVDSAELVNAYKITNLRYNPIPDRTALLQNYPNPFNPETWIPFQLKDTANVVISIYDVDGQLVRKIGLGKIPAGMYLNKDKAVYWDGCNNAGEQISSGLYFYQLQAGEYSKTKRMLIMK